MIRYKIALRLFVVPYNIFLSITYNITIIFIKIKITCNYYLQFVEINVVLIKTSLKINYN